MYPLSSVLSAVWHSDYTGHIFWDPNVYRRHRRRRPGHVSIEMWSTYTTYAPIIMDGKVYVDKIMPTQYATVREQSHSWIL